jgi:4-amino-4-deoxy-L-arabinose transferase-like glycosyltransferase
MESTKQKSLTGLLTSDFRSTVITVLLVVLALAGIANHELWTPDEPREAAIALSMSRSGNFIIPELAGKPFVEKPSLFYIIASFYLVGLGKIIGNTAVLRLVSATFGLLTLFFTYQLGKIYFSRKQALIAAGILATMIGFVYVSHWLLVDNALMFFITACIWALAQTYERDRPLYLLLGAVLAAGTFLTKGFIGPIIIFFAWLGLFIPWVNKLGLRQSLQTLQLHARDSLPELDQGSAMVERGAATFSLCSRGTLCRASLKFLSNKNLGIHFISLGIVLLISATWVIAFAIQGGPELFREWWWLNHFGRFTGQSINLGHISPWYYYFAILPVYILPWIVPFLIGLLGLFKRMFRHEMLSSGAVLLLVWFLGTFLLLSLSATKRDIYLCVLLPACSLLCAQGLKDNETRLTLYQNWIISIGFAWAILLIVACPIIDRTKNYGPAFKTMAAFLKSHPELKTAGYKLDETTLAGLYYYGDISLPVISNTSQFDDIMQGQNNRFNSALILHKNLVSKDLSDVKNPVIFEMQMGERRRLQLLATTKGN